MISLVISVCFLLVTDTIGITLFLIVYTLSPPERVLCELEASVLGPTVASKHQPLR